jgi:hypothetical protein
MRPQQAQSARRPDKSGVPRGRSAASWWYGHGRAAPIISGTFPVGRRYKGRDSSIAAGYPSLQYSISRSDDDYEDEDMTGTFSHSGAKAKPCEDCLHPQGRLPIKVV